MPSQRVGQRAARRSAPGADQPPRRAERRAPALAALETVAAADPMARIARVRRGVPASVVPRVAAALGLPRATLDAALGLSGAAADRQEQQQVRARGRLGLAASERVLGVVDLIARVRRMWRESGDRAAAPGFDPARWLGAWLDDPNPALGGRRPGALLDTADGRALVGHLLGSMQAGTYW